MFSQVDASSSVYKYSGSALGTAAGSSSNSVGSEWDLSLTYQANQDLTLTGGGALMNSGSFSPSYYFDQMQINL